MGRGALAGALVGVAQGLVAVMLVVTLGAGPRSFGWFAYTPLQEGAGFVVSGPPAVARDWLLVPLVLAALGAVAGRFRSRSAEEQGAEEQGAEEQGAEEQGDRRVLALGVAGLVVAVVAVALASHVGSRMPRRYADYLPLENAGPSVSPVVLLVAGSLLGALALVALTGLAQGRRWGWIGTLVAVGLGLVGLGFQLFRTGLAPLTLGAEVVALALVVAALVLARRSVVRG